MSHGPAACRMPKQTESSYTGTPPVACPRPTPRRGGGCHQHRTCSSQTAPKPTCPRVTDGQLRPAAVITQQQVVQQLAALQPAIDEHKGPHARHSMAAAPREVLARQRGGRRRDPAAARGVQHDGAGRLVHLRGRYSTHSTQHAAGMQGWCWQKASWDYKAMVRGVANMAC
jgi:hypothetical protein